jgi:protein gp37
MSQINWVISGGESGPNARPADINWFRSLRDQCAEHNVAYWHKQNGGRSGDKGGCLLDGQILQQFPT